MASQGVFVIGVDTGVGKTTLCAGLLKMMVGGAGRVAYWKPVQTGTIVGDDTKDIKKATQLSDDHFIEPSYRFTDPLSPHFAAKKWGKTIDMRVLQDAYEAARKRVDFLIVEGAGGLLVPFNDDSLQIDFIKTVKLPLLVCATDRVGAINQTLLTLNACRAENITVHGVVVMKSRGNLGNSEGIAKYGKVEIVAELPPAEDMSSLIGQVAAHSRLRKLFGLTPLPT